MARQYILDENNSPVPVHNVLAWARWMAENEAKCVVRRDWIGKVMVSTVFLGINHNFLGGTPILWETMIFGEAVGEYDQWQSRYSSFEDAVAGHDVAVQMVHFQLQTKKVGPPE